VKNRQDADHRGSEEKGDRRKKMGVKGMDEGEISISVCRCTCDQLSDMDPTMYLFNTYNATSLRCVHPYAKKNNSPCTTGQELTENVATHLSYLFAIFVNCC
jgi:hypothetical protein